MKDSLPIMLLLCWLGTTHAFLVTNKAVTPSWRTPGIVLRSTSTSTTASSELEQWVLQQGGSIDPAVTHAKFGELRGLKMDKTVTESNTRIGTIPNKIVLSSPYNEDWDTNLAMDLLLLMKQETVSPYYCLLRDGAISTAPHSLRRWTNAQKERLKQCDRGRKLLEFQTLQEQSWRDKYQKLLSSSTTIGWEDFEWAMEAVHSRAFRGITTSSNIAVFSLLAPVVAGLLGMVYWNSVTYQKSELVLVGLGAMAVLPTLFQIFQKDTTRAVLLPWMDSANHLEEAGSTIDFDPISDSFSLSVSPNCVDDDTSQLFISYGTKSDSELLLNYGFLPGVELCKDEDEYRAKLAQAFVKRNP